MQLDEKNEWIVLADSIDWDRWESEYAKKFESPRGNPAKPLRMALGALLVQKRKGLSDRKLVAEIAENPYVQYFLGLPNFTSECPFTAPALVYFRQRLNADMIMKINDWNRQRQRLSTGKKTKVIGQRKQTNRKKNGTISGH